MPTVTEAIKKFLAAQQSKVHNPGILARYDTGMEVQVNVKPGDNPVEGKRNTWDDGQYIFHNLRVPHDAKSDPHFEDYDLRYPLDLYAEAIGMTGWNWKNRQSVFWGYDWDSITGHAPGVGISNEELERVKEAAKSLPYVEIRKSTKGKGLHLFVFGNGVECQNHTEHAAIARSILTRMSQDTGFDFTSHVDACGGNLWVWSKHASKEAGSYELVKAHSETLTLADLPANWRDNVEVVTRRRSKVRVSGMSSEAHLSLEDLTASRTKVPLDEKHKALISILAKSGFSSIWIHDHWLMQTHTKALANLVADPSNELVGSFTTISQGNNPGEPNCFMFPLLGGAWKVYRFSPGAKEVETWQQDGRDWTTCFFNRLPDFHTAAITAGGNELPNEKGFEFPTAKVALQVIERLGGQLELPERFAGRTTTLKRNKDGRMVIELKRESEDSAEPGWTKGGQGNGRWQKVINVRTESHRDERTPLDSLVRAQVTPNNEFAGFYTRSNLGTWDYAPATLAKNVVQSHGYTPTVAGEILGLTHRDRWMRVSIPYAEEFPGGRQWNMGAAQLTVRPADEVGSHPSWDLIHQNLGQSLDDALKTLEWASEAGIRTGSDYLRTWLAVMIRQPFDRSPFLFFHGPEDSGKSIFWESAALFTTGVVKADRALTSSNDFNGELATAVLCVIEEKNLSAYPGAKNKIKDLVTSPTLAIRKMRTDTYQIPNVTRCAQFSNHEKEAAIDPGDTRITVLFVPQLDKSKMIAKSVLMDRLKEEAPCFLRTLLDLRLPPASKSRLRPPVVETKHKRAIVDLGNPLCQFVRECCELDPEAKVAKPQFFRKWEEWCQLEGHEAGDRNDIGTELKTVTAHKVTTKGKAIDPTDNRRKDAYAGIRLKS